MKKKCLFGSVIFALGLWFIPLTHAVYENNLLEAALKHDFWNVVEYVKYGANIHAKGYYGITPLKLAKSMARFRKNGKEMVQLLLNNPYS